MKKWANVPFAPAKCPFFYGWVIVGIATLSIICSIPGQTAGIGLFTDDLIETLAITRNQLSVAYMVGTIISGLALPFAGQTAGQNRRSFHECSFVNRIGQ